MPIDTSEIKFVDAKDSEERDISTMIYSLGLSPTRNDAIRKVKEGAIRLRGNKVHDWLLPVAITADTLIGVGSSNFIVRPHQ